MSFMDPIIIVGSGLAGYTLAREIRKLDQEIPLTLISADDGRYYSKPQLSSALTHNKTAASLGLMDAARMQVQLKATLLNNTWVTGIDTQQQRITAGEQVLPYSKLVFAVGAETITAPFSGDGAAKSLTVNNLQDYEYFRDSLEGKKHVAIIGAGLVGCEFANDLVNGGYEVSVIALSETPLNLLLPTEAGKALAIGLAQAGVDWHLGCSVRSIETDHLGYKLTLSNDKQIKTDMVLSAIGLRPRTDLAETAGLKVERGIVVDRLLETSAANVYALGDCAELEGQVLLYVMPLVIGAKALANTLLGQATPVNYPPMPIIIKTPACPVVVHPPLNTAHGEWITTGDGINIKALYYDHQQQLQGFALTGAAVEEKLSLIELLPKTIF